ncbi:MAG: hydantoinase/oxoprolinase family protein [Burkholderiales bacterium]
MKTETLSIGIDIGGTFTDVVCRLPDGSLKQFKLPSTRANPAQAVRDAVAFMVREWKIAPADIGRFVHGTTVATNAVLERKGAKVGLLTTEGFRDVLEIGRGNRQEIYATVVPPQTPVFLAPREFRRGVPERLTVDGAVLTPLDEAALAKAVEALVAEGAEALAVCFLFSYLNPAHEQRARAIIRKIAPGLLVSLSSDVDPAFREYERTTVTAFDAYVKPVLDRYLTGMEQNLAADGVAAPLQIMQSRGGVCSAAVARERPVRLFLSGPAAGAIGGALIGARTNEPNLITVDIGGTSCDIALITGGTPLIRTDGIIDRYPVRVPMVDVNAIGAGGGSIAWLDGSGLLRVGPHSAGSEPGPACYGRGATDPTVTDASVVLGYLNPAFFAGGALKLDPRKAFDAIRTKIAEPMKMSVEEAALGIHRVINAQMAEGIRLTSINRGVDPREYALVGLGGAGPLHAAALAQDLYISRVLIPSRPGVLSAIGLLAAPIEHEAFLAYPQRFEEVKPAAILAQLKALDTRCAELMTLDRVTPDAVRIAYSADVCFVGQSYYLEVPVDPAAPDTMLATLYDGFLAAHERIYGHATRAPARIVNLRSVHRAGGGLTINEPAPPAGSTAKPKATREVLLAEERTPVAAAVYDRDALPVGVAIPGPAIVEQTDTTTLVPAGWTAKRLASGDMLMTFDV